MHTSPMERLLSEREQAQRDAEVRLAHEIRRAYPELTYGECLRHAYAKLKREREHG